MKPTCKCGLEMRVIEFKGYYDNFKFWGFDRKCKCTKGRVRNFNQDKVKVGAYSTTGSIPLGSTLKKPSCKCEKEMQVVAYRGYYDDFKFWEQNSECVCMGDPYDFKVDEVIYGGYAN